MDGVTQFIGTALKAGSAAIVIATESHRERLLPRLQIYVTDMTAAIEQGRYISLDAADTLSKFIFNGVPDLALFSKLLGGLIATAAEAGKGEPARVAIFGECVHLLWAQGNAEAAIQIEKLGNQLANTYEVDILCGYSLASVQGGMDSHIFQRICAEHSAVHCPVAGLRLSHTISPLHGGNRALLPVVYEHGSWFQPSVSIQSKSFHSPIEHVRACS